METVRRIAAASVLAYLALTVLFYVLAGEQLHLRESRGTVELPAAGRGTVELTAGHAVEQTFCVSIQRLESVEVQWGAYYRANTGTVHAELRDGRDGSVLLTQRMEASAIEEGGVTVLAAAEPLEGLYGVPLVLRLTADSPAGGGVSPLLSGSGAPEGWSLTVDGSPAEGALCLAARGTDYIWTGLHYWQFVLAGLALLLAGLAVMGRRVRQGRRSYVGNAVVALRKYRFLIRQLVERDFKTKYKRSVLGVFWSFLNPLLTMGVQYIIFSTIFRSDIPNYAVYLLVGVVSFNFFSESCSMALSSIVGNAGLITKVYLPKYIYPLTRVMSSVVNLGISLIPLLLMTLATGLRLHKAAVLGLYFLFCLVVFSLGLGLLLSAAMVFFRDVQFLWGVLSMIWMYATPIFYPERIIPERFRFIQTLNPLYHFLKNTRVCILEGISPEPAVYVYCLGAALLMLGVGALVFRRTQDRFVLYI